MAGKDNKIFWIIGIIIIGIFLLNNYQTQTDTSAVKNYVKAPSGLFSIYQEGAICCDIECNNICSGDFNSCKPLCADVCPAEIPVWCDTGWCGDSESYCESWRSKDLDSCDIDSDQCCSSDWVYQYNTNQCCPLIPHPHLRADGLCYASPDYSTDNYYTRRLAAQGMSPFGWNTNVCGGVGNCSIDGDWETSSANQPQESSWVEKCFNINYENITLHTKFSDYAEQAPVKTYIKRDGGSYNEIILTTHPGCFANSCILPGYYGEVETPVNRESAGQICAKIELNPDKIHAINYLFEFELKEVKNCNTKADADCNQFVDRIELENYIWNWIFGAVNRDELGLAIVAWMAG